MSQQEGRRSKVGFGQRIRERRQTSTAPTTEPASSNEPSRNQITKRNDPGSVNAPSQSENKGMKNDVVVTQNDGCDAFAANKQTPAAGLRKPDCGPDHTRTSKQPSHVLSLEKSVVQTYLVFSQFDLKKRIEGNTTVLKDANLVKSLPDGGESIRKRTEDMRQVLEYLELKEQDSLASGMRRPPTLATASLQAESSHTPSSFVNATSSSSSRDNSWKACISHGQENGKVKRQVGFRAYVEDRKNKSKSDKAAARGSSNGTSAAAKPVDVTSLFSSLVQSSVDSFEPVSPSGDLTATLYPYQQHGLSWMIQRETSGTDTIPFRGGILADEMGLGKTVQAISLIATQRQLPQNVPVPDGTSAEKKESGGNNKEKRRERISSSATLVVCPLALMDQWCEEVVKHTRPGALSIFKYHGGSRKRDPHALSSYDIVVTTYGVIDSEFKALVQLSSSPPPSLPSRGGKKKSTNTNWEADVVAEDGVHAVQWMRVMLDEAHTIRNHKTQLARSVYNISASYRWFVSGTPLQNALKDMYSAFVFLRYEPYDKSESWKRYFGKEDAVAVERLFTLLQPITLRRRKDTKNDNGEDMVSLPDRQIVMHRLEMTGLEADLYNSMMNKFRTKARRLGSSLSSKKGACSTVLRMLLRLQQVCSHVRLCFGDQGKLLFDLADPQKQSTSLYESGKVFSPKYIFLSSRAFRLLVHTFTPLLLCVCFPYLYSAFA